MKVTATEEYGLRCLLDIARHSTAENAVTIKSGAGREKLTVAYTSKLLGVLRTAGLVKAVRGRGGGYILTRKPEDIVLKDVMDALGDQVLSKDHCDRFKGDGETCVHKENCTVRSVWSDLDRFINRFFRNITVADLINGGYRKHNIDLFFGRTSIGSDLEMQNRIGN